MRTIRYQFTFEDGKSLSIEVPLDEDTLPEDLPEWTHLECQQCPNCSLNQKDHPYCPAAVRTHEIAAQFSEIISYTRAHVEVTVGERTYVADCDVNTALRSLMGLCMALSSCPLMGRLRPLAETHFPFATLEETAGRTIRAYLFKQYFIMQDGGDPDWEFKGLIALYEAINIATSAFTERIRIASKEDANMNAVTGLAGFSAFFTMGLLELIEEEKQSIMRAF